MDGRVESISRLELDAGVTVVNKDEDCVIVIDETSASTEEETGTKEDTVLVPELRVEITDPELVADTDIKSRADVEERGGAEGASTIDELEAREISNVGEDVEVRSKVEEDVGDACMIDELEAAEVDGGSLYLGIAALSKELEEGDAVGIGLGCTP